MARITHTGDIGRAPLPTTHDLLRDHAADCLIKSYRLKKEANRLIEQYGSAAEGAVQKLYNESGHWGEQGRLAHIALAMIARGGKI